MSPLCSGRSYGLPSIEIAFARAAPVRPTFLAHAATMTAAELRRVDAKDWPGVCAEMVRDEVVFRCGGKT